MSEREPTRDELEAMAYVDGELAPQARARFEERLGREPALAREVTALRALELVARRAAPPEPMDHEWQRLARSRSQRGLWFAGWAALLAGLAGLLGWSLWCLECSSWPLAPKILLPLALAGSALLVGAAVRARRRTMRYDPYRDVQR